MAEKVAINFEALNTVGNQFQQQAEQVQQIINLLTPKIEDLRGGGWIGKGANAFYLEMDDRVLPTLIALKRALEETQSTLNQVATDFSNADDEISQIAASSQ